MRLLNTSTLQLEEFFTDVPKYAILSHTWEPGEVLFTDIQNRTASFKQGFAKVTKCCELAASEQYQYVWIDTCCIDKSSSAELSEAINSMYAYYEGSSICYVYLDINVPVGRLTAKILGKARWAYRGWTLQELIAPRFVNFYDKNWNFCGTKWTDSAAISEVTRIDGEMLKQETTERLWLYSTAIRMSWASKRETTRPEDLAYCLLGIFNVNMSPLYGEGAQKAFLRLQNEIMKTSTDLSILAWWSTSRYLIEDVSVLATLPAFFASSIVRFNGYIDVHAFQMTNRGLRVKLPLIINEEKRQCVAILPNCQWPNAPETYVGITLCNYEPDLETAEWCKLMEQRSNVWYRYSPDNMQVEDPTVVCKVGASEMRSAKVAKIYLSTKTANIAKNFETLAQSLGLLS